MENELETSQDTLRIKTDEKGRFMEGTAPGPGRPKGSISIKDKVRQYLDSHPEEVEEIVEHFVKKNRELMWQMLEGRPPQKLEQEGEISLKHYVITDDGTNPSESLQPSSESETSNSGQA